MGHSDEEKQFRAQIALRSIHEARTDADEAIDALMQVHQADDGSGRTDRSRSEALQHAHNAVMKLYNRLRPYVMTDDSLAESVELYVETDEDGSPIYETVNGDDGEPLTDKNGENIKVKRGIFGLKSLDSWRLGSTTIEQREENVGEADTVQQVKRSIHLPEEVALAAYDALNEAIVKLSFGAEPGKDVPMTHLDDAPERVGTGEKPDIKTGDDQ